MQFFEKIINYLAEVEKVNRQNIQGCSEKEIDQIEKLINRPLPMIYKDFLLSMGKGTADWYLVDYEIFYDSFMDNHRHFKDDFEKIWYKVFQDILIIFTHDSGAAVFIKLKEPDIDPRLYYLTFESSDGGPIEEGGDERLSDFFNTEFIAIGYKE